MDRMTTLDDALAIREAIQDAGRPLTLTEAGHAASITRWRAYKAVRLGVGAGGFTYVRVGAHWRIDTSLSGAPAAPATPTVVATLTEATCTFVPPDPGGAPILQYDVETMSTTTPTPWRVVVQGSPAVVQNFGEWVTGDTVSMRVRAVNVVGYGPWSDWGTDVSP
jgi:hypothetical protein